MARDWSQFQVKEPEVQKPDWSKFKVQTEEPEVFTNESIKSSLGKPEKEETESPRFKLPKSLTIDPMAMAVQSAAKLGQKIGSKDSVIQQTAASLNKMYLDTLRIPAQVVTASNIPTNYIRKKQGLPQVEAPDWMYDNSATQYFEQSRDAHNVKEQLFKDKDMVSIISQGKPSEVAEYIGLSLIEQAPQQIALLASAMSGVGGAGLAFMGLSEASRADYDAKKKGVEPLARSYNAVTRGVIEAAFERIGTLGLFNKISSQMAKRFGKVGTKEIMKDVGKYFGIAVLGEANEEGLTSFAQDFSDWATGVNPDSIKGMGRRAFESSVLGGLMGGGMTAPAAISQGVRSAEIQDTRSKWAKVLKEIRTQQQAAKSEASEFKPGRIDVETPQAKESPETPKESQIKPFKDFKPTEAIDQPKSSLMQRSEYLFSKLEEESAFQIGELAELQNQLDATEVLSERAELGNKMRDIESEINKNREALQQKLNDDAEVAIQRIVDYASSSGIRWPKARAKEFKETLIQRITDESTSEETTPRQIADELIKNYAQEDAARKARPPETKTVIGYVRAAGGINPESVKAAGFVTDEDFRQSGLVGVVREGGKDFDSLATSMIHEGIVAEVPNESPTQTVLNAMKARKKRLDELQESTDALMAKYEKEIGDAAEEFERGFADIEGQESTEPTVQEIRAVEIEGEVEGNQEADDIELFQEAETQTDTPQFKAWFGDSKVVDENGKPLVVYHGTDKVFTSFDIEGAKKSSSNGMLELGFHFGTAEQANERMRPIEQAGTRKIEGQPSIIPVYLSLQNPLWIPSDLGDWADMNFIREYFGPENYEVFTKQELTKLKTPDDVRKALLKKGYDGIRYSNEQEGEGDSWIAFNPVDIKSSTGNSGAFSLDSDDIRYQEKQDTFFSQLENTIKDKMPNSAHPDHIKGILKSGNIKKEEMDWLDIEGFLEGKQKVSKQELLDYIAANNVQIQEVEKGKELTHDDLKWMSRGNIHKPSSRFDVGHIEYLTSNGRYLYEGPAGIRSSYPTLDEAKDELLRIAKNKGIDGTKFSQYQLPGGENYREMLLTVPSRTPDKIEDLSKAMAKPYDYKSPHFDEPNIIAHFRMNDRTIENPEHAKAVKEGDHKKLEILNRENRVSYKALHIEEVQSDRKVAMETAKARGDQAEVERLRSLMPFADKYYELAWKRILRYAAENGYDMVTFNTGEQQADRYDLSKQVDVIAYEKFPDGRYELMVGPKNSDDPINKILEENELAEFIGKDIAEKIISGEGKSIPNDSEVLPGGKKLDGLDLKVGGEGKKKLYDQIFVQFLNKYTKKWGGRVQAAELDLVVETFKDGTKAIHTPGLAEQIKDNRENLKHGLPVHSLELTPDLKKSVLQGQPLFQESKAIGDSTFAIEKAKLEELLKKNDINDIIIQIADKIVTPSGKEAYGAYNPKTRTVRLVARPRSTTGPHEGGHIIIREAGLLDRLPEVYDELGTNDPKQAEEVFMDEFAEYVRNRKTFTGKLKHLFDQLLDWIRRFLGRPSNRSPKETMFEEMFTGNYQAKKKVKSEEPLYQEKDNPINAPTPDRVEKMKPLQEELRQVNEKINSLKRLGQTNKGYESRRDFLVNELNKILAPRTPAEAAEELKQYIKQFDFFEAELPLGGNPILSGINPLKLKDLTGMQAALRDVYRNFEHVFGSQFPMIKKELLDPLDESRGKFVDMQKAWTDELDKTIVKKLGIKAKTREAAAVQEYGEGDIDYETLKKRFGQKRADNIVEADAWFRVAYNDLLDRVNASIARIYPGQADKLIPKRRSYYRHFREFSSLAGLMNIFDTPANISSRLAGISEHTKPKSKWLSFAQRRLGIETEVDAVRGFIDYLPAAAYATHISPNIPRFRLLAKELRISTAERPDDKQRLAALYEARRVTKDPLQKDEIQGRIDSISQKNYLNQFIAFLDDYAGALAGKTNPYLDRDIQKLFGRKVVSVLNWANSRVKANVILMNAGTAIVQIANAPMAIGHTKLYSILGFGDSIAQVFGQKKDAINQSTFLRTRYAESMYDKFDRGWVTETIPYPMRLRNFAKWMLIVGDEVTSKFIWNSFYEKAVARKIPQPIKYADDMTRKMVAGRSAGEVPLLQQAKAFQVLAPFMIEVQNLNWELKDRIKDKDFSTLVVFLIANWLLNSLFEKIKGHRVTLDPLDAAIDAFTGDKTPEQRLGRLIGEILSNVPGGYLAMGFYPEYGTKYGDYQLPTRKQFFGEETVRFGKGLLQSGISDPLYKLIPPLGGSQAKKIIGGNKAISEGKVMHGKKAIYVSDDAINRLMANLFGPYGMREVREYFKERLQKSQERYMLKRRANL
jgi:hypothetical protein